MRLLPLRVEREPGHVDHVVHHAHGDSHQAVKFIRVDSCIRPERVMNKAGQVDRAQEAGTIRRQGLLPAGIGRGNRLAIVEIVAFVDPVNENDAGFGIVEGRLHDPVPQVTGANRLPDLVAEHEVPAVIGLHRFP